VPGPIVSSLRGGRFRILGLLGEGTQGRTYDGVDAREGRPVAIKRFDVRGATAWKDVELAEREARVLQALSHPRLPRYIDRFEEDGALYLVMDKIEGESLAVVRKREGAIGEREVARLLRDAAEVLAYLHGRSPPVIHRDLKPANVIRRPDGSFAFVDFGAVRDKLRPEGGSTVVGTFGYMAPEQFQGRALPASDVYAMGATAVSMLAGREPEELPHKGLSLDVRAALAGRASDRMIAVLEKMVEPDPDRRAGSIAALLTLLEGRSSPRERQEQRRAAPWESEWRDTFEREMQEWSTRYQRKHARREARRDAATHQAASPMAAARAARGSVAVFDGARADVRGGGGLRVLRDPGRRAARPARSVDRVRAAHARSGRGRPRRWKDRSREPPAIARVGARRGAGADERPWGPRGGRARASSTRGGGPGRPGRARSRR
jgi:serine/threonine protein kinase